MGYATIVSGGEDGRYVIQVDTGEALRQQLLEQVTLEINRLELDVLQAQVKVDEADADDAFNVAQFNALADSMAGDANSPAFNASNIALKGARKIITDGRLRNYPFRVALDAAKFRLAQARKLAASLNTVQTLITKNAWCTDLTVDASPGDVVATMDIPGDTNLQLIAPGARGWTPQDGQIFERALLSPAQVYLFAAIFPGWQKFLPTYRWGTISAINFDNDTATVDLFAQTSTAQRLGVNQSSSLVDVPIVYMTCNSAAFDIGDRVVVQFVGQDWNNPRIVGFLDNPKPCDLECFHLFASEYLFQVRSETLMTGLFSGAASFEVNLNGAGWTPMTLAADPPSSLSYLKYEYLFDEGLSHVWISISRYGVELPQILGGAPPFINVSVTPSPPYPPARPPEDINIAEVRIKLSGEVVFNAAVRDMGWLGEGITTGYCATRRGIRLLQFPNSTGTAVLPLDYTLTGDA
jgi:hypothetical protein